MLALSVTLENGEAVRKRLLALANAAKVFGESKAKVGTDDPVGRFVEYGTRPHDIYPRNKQALYWPGARHPVSVVHHPGTRPNPFLERALDKSRDAIEHEVVRRLDMVAGGSGSNYTQTMEAAGTLLLDAARKEAPVGPDTPTRKGGTLRNSLYLV